VIPFPFPLFFFLRNYPAAGLATRYVTNRVRRRGQGRRGPACTIASLPWPLGWRHLSSASNCRPNREDIQHVRVLARLEEPGRSRDRLRSCRPKSGAPSILGSSAGSGKARWRRPGTGFLAVAARAARSAKQGYGLIRLAESAETRRGRGLGGRAASNKLLETAPGDGPRQDAECSD